MADDARVDQLALAYQAGQRCCLGELHEALQPVIGRALARVLRRYDSLQRLPAALEAADLVQQSWVLLAELAQRWSPELGSFTAYIAGSLPWALERYVCRHSAERRSASVQVFSADAAEVHRLQSEQAGDDGRVWIDRLVWQELLGKLSSLQRQVVVLRAAEHRSFASIASMLGISLRRAQRAFLDAQALLRSEAAIGLSSGLEPDLARLIQALHDGAAADGLAPGRSWVCARTGLSQSRYRQLMQYLVAAGGIRGRTARHPGWLVEPTAEATLARVASSGQRGRADGDGVT